MTATWTYRFSFFLLLSILVLILAGGLVTSHEAGLAVPDWPLSYGQWFPPMVGNVVWEHGHRMIAGVVGILTLILTVSIQLFESRSWLKRFAWVAFAVLCFLGSWPDLVLNMLASLMSLPNRWTPFLWLPVVGIGDAGNLGRTQSFLGHDDQRSHGDIRRKPLYELRRKCDIRRRTERQPHPRPK